MTGECTYVYGQMESEPEKSGLPGREQKKEEYQKKGKTKWGFKLGGERKKEDRSANIQIRKQ